jgi:PAS domain S-box-containing protein
MLIGWWINKKLAGPSQVNHTQSNFKINTDHLFELSVDMLGVADFNGRFLELNAAWEDTLGIKSEKLCSKPFVEFIHPEDQEKTQRAVAKVVYGTKLIGIQSRFQCNDGSYKWLSWNAVPHMESRLTYISARDVTFAVQKEKDLDQHLSRLSLLRRIDAELTRKLDLEYVLLIGLDHALRISNADTGFICLIAPDGTLAISQSIGGYGDGEPPYIDEGGIIRLTLEEQRPQWIHDVNAQPNTFSVVEMHSQLALPLFAHNELLGAICVEASDVDRFNHDIVNFMQLISVYIGIGLNNAQLLRSIEQSRALYETLVHNLPSTVVLLINRDLRFVLAEGFGLEDIGYSKELLEGKTVWEALPPQAAEQLATMYRLAFEGEHVRFEYQSQIAPRTYDMQIVPLPDGQGNIEQALVLAHDVTELHTLISELDAFSGTVAHDLKSPLNLIIGYTSLMLSDNAISADNLDTLRIVAKTGHKMSQIITELLQMSSLRKLTDVPLDTLNLPQILGEVYSRLRFMIEDYQPQIVEPDEWVSPLGYGPWVEEVYANFISNAMKYGGEPPVIELGSTALPDNRVKLWVRDNGKGLTDEEQSKLFTEFSRLERTRASGHGLGLSIVKRIVEKMGGEVGVESVVGEGSTFYFILTADRLPEW